MVLSITSIENSGKETCLVRCKREQQCFRLHLPSSVFIQKQIFRINFMGLSLTFITYLIMTSITSFLNSDIGRFLDHMSTTVFVFQVSEYAGNKHTAKFILLNLAFKHDRQTTTNPLSLKYNCCSDRKYCNPF